MQGKKVETNILKSYGVKKLKKGRLPLFHAEKAVSAPLIRRLPIFKKKRKRKIPSYFIHL
jgi:hypothetical protein